MARTRLCEICKQPIDADRADGLPDTRPCGQHAEEVQAFGDEFIMTAEQERTSKASSLKVNYGGIATTKTRNYRAMAKLRDAYDKARTK